MVLGEAGRGIRWGGAVSEPANVREHEAPGRNRRVRIRVLLKIRITKSKKGVMTGETESVEGLIHGCGHVLPCPCRNCGHIEFCMGL